MGQNLVSPFLHGQVQVHSVQEDKSGFWAVLVAQSLGAEVVSPAQHARNAAADASEHPA